MQKRNKFLNLIFIGLTGLALSFCGSNTQNGRDGKDGKNGLEGKPGANGKDGVDGKAGANANSTVATSDDKRFLLMLSAQGYADTSTFAQAQASCKSPYVLPTSATAKALLEHIFLFKGKRLSTYLQNNVFVWTSTAPTAVEDEDGLIEDNSDLRLVLRIVDRNSANPDNFKTSLDSKRISEGTGAVLCVDALSNNLN